LSRLYFTYANSYCAARNSSIGAQSKHTVFYVARIENLIFSSPAILFLFRETTGYVVGWVDIGTVAKVPLNVVVYLKKVGKIT
jgi:hypothetical protein